MKIIPSEVKTSVLHSYLLGAIAPRPICFASTIDSLGRCNLSPFSFFNIFGSKPPLLIFSPSRRVRDNTIKHTLENIYETKEVVINVVNYSMVQQVSLSSCEYAKDTDEFLKSGFTKVKSEFVKPFCVKESPVQIECKVLNIIETGTEGGAANLVLCEVLCMHIDDAVLNDKRQIDPNKIDLVARMGADFYCRASGYAVFEVPKPNTMLGIGIDALPESIRNSLVLSGNDLGILGNCAAIPDVITNFADKRINEIIHSNSDINLERHKYAKQLIEFGEIEKAWQVLLLK